MPLYIELLYQAFDFTGAFAMSSILVIMAVAILIARNVLEYRGKKDAETELDAGTAKNKKKSYEQVDAVAAETV
jgi:ABC-type sulfate transport system permease subunit